MADDYQIEEIYVNSTSEYAIKNVDWGEISESDILVFACDSNGDVVRYENWELSKRESDGTWDIKIYPSQNSFTAYVVRNELASMQWSETANANLSVDAIKKQIENIVRVIKQLELINKTVIRTVDDISVPLPCKEHRKGKFISFDDNGNPVCEVNVNTFESNKASAEDAQEKAETAQEKAETAQKKAEISESNAKDYAESASKSAESASSSAKKSSESEKNALAYATMASNSSNTASNSAEVAKECKSKAEEYAQVAKSSANLTGAYANTTTEMLTGKHAISYLRFKTELGEQIVVKAEIVNGVPMLVPTIASDYLDDAFSVLQWKTVSGQKFVVFAEIINGVPMLSCKI